MGQLYDNAMEIAQRIRSRCDRKVDLCVILGSGLGAFVDALENAVVIPYSEIEGFPTSSVHGHAGNLVFGQLNGKDLVVMQGRVHLYEGYTPHDASTIMNAETSNASPSPSAFCIVSAVPA